MILWKHVGYSVMIKNFCSHETTVLFAYIVLTPFDIKICGYYVFLTVRLQVSVLHWSACLFFFTSLRGGFLRRPMEPDLSLVKMSRRMSSFQYESTFHNFLRLCKRHRNWSCLIRFPECYGPLDLDVEESKPRIRFKIILSYYHFPSDAVKI